jgi:hypothetical protein
LVSKPLLLYCAISDRATAIAEAIMPESRVFNARPSPAQEAITT